MQDHERILRQYWLRIRENRPLIHNITNFVVMERTANSLLALGASPIMAHAPEELEAISAQSQALVINIGTLDQAWLSAMRLAISAAQQAAVPIILDPVGAGATRFRTESVLSLLEIAQPSVIRGNASEILALSGELVESRGVDSLYEAKEAMQAALFLAQRYQTVVVVSGAEDLIVEEGRCFKVQNGCSMMTHITGMGCAGTALIGAFVAVGHDDAQSAACAMATMGLAGEIALKRSAGPGSFSVHFLDALYSLSQGGSFSEVLKWEEGF